MSILRHVHVARARWGAMELATKLAQRLVDGHPIDAAAALETYPVPDAADVLHGARPDAAARVLRNMSPHRAVEILETWAVETVGAVLGHMPPDAAATLLRRTSQAFRANVLENLSGRTGRTLRSLLEYSPDSAATRMDPHVLALPDDLTVEQATIQVRESAKHVLFNLYVVDRQHVLVGVMNLRELLISKPDARLADVMNTVTFRIAADADRRAILQHPGWREVHSLPVVDAKGRFLGALRYRTLRRLQADALRRGGDSQETVGALADLFWTGVAGVLNSVTMAGGKDAQLPEEHGDGR